MTLQTSGTSAALRRRLSLSGPALVAACKRLENHPQLPRLYPEYLILLHTIVRAAVPLMADALRQLEQGRRADPLADPLIAYLEHHGAEEEGHDTWILEDLQVVGVSRAAALARLPSPTVAGLVGAQYYWIRHCHPVGLLGYMAVLEGNPPSVEAVDQLCRRSGLPVAAFRTLREHAASDGDHKRDLDDLVDRLPMTSEQFLLVCFNAAATTRGLIQCVDELIEDLPDEEVGHLRAR